jgi:hypothetical protein
MNSYRDILLQLLKLIQDTYLGTEWVKDPLLLIDYDKIRKIKVSLEGVGCFNNEDVMR